MLSYTRRSLAARLLAFGSIALLSFSSSADASTWLPAAGGSWATASNWDTVPNAVDATADISQVNITANATINLDGNRTVGTLIFGDTTPSNNWTLASGTPATSSITLATTSGTPTINVVNQTATISAIIAGTQGIQKTGTGTLTLTGANTFSGGLNISAGNVRLGTSAGAAGTGTVTINPNTTLVGTSATTFSSPLNLAGGTIGSSTTGADTFSGALNVSANSTIRAADPAALGTNGELVFTGVMSGSGNINVLSGTNNLGVDGGVGVRFRATGASTYSGTITIGNNVKGELQVAAANYTPIGTGKVVLTAGDAALGNGLNASTTTGGYSEFNIRNNFAANIIVPTNFEVTGTGLTVINLPGGSGTLLQTLGNLRIGTGQEIAVWKSSTGATTFQRLGFDTVTLTGNATFSPKKNGFGVANADAGDMILGNISEVAAGSSVTMNGLRTLQLNGNNTFTGGLFINSGTVQLGNAGALNSTTPQTVTFNASSTGVLRVNGGSYTGGGLVTNAVPGTTFLENGATGAGTYTVNNTGSANFAGVLRNGGTGVLNFVKTGSGTQTLSGDNTHTGSTTVNGGVLALTSASANNIPTSLNVVVGASGTLNVTGLAAGAGLSVASGQTITNNGTVTGAVTVPSGSFVTGNGGTFQNNVLFQGGAEKVTINGATSNLIHINGAADFSGGGGIQIFLTAPATLPFYDVLTYGTLPVAPTITPSVGRTNFSIDPTGPANTIRIKATGGPASITWNNAGGSPADGVTWGIQTNKNWENGGVSDFYYEFDNVTFNDANNGHYAVSIPSAVLPGAVTVDNSAGDYSLGNIGELGSITGLGTLTKTGTGALTLNTPNTYSGGTVFSAGTLNLNHASALGTGPLTMNSGNLGNTSNTDITLSTNNAQTWGAASITYNSPNSLNLGSGAVTMNTNPTITVSNAATRLTVGGAINAGTGTSITKAGPGTLALTGNNTALTGGITLNEGVLRVTGTNSAGSGTVSVATGTQAIFGSTQINSIAAANNTIISTGGSDYTMAATGTMNVNGTITLNTFDPQEVIPPANPASRNFQVDGTLTGSGTINIVNATGVTSPDGTSGFRLRGGASTFSGTINVPQTAKFELRTITAGPMSPAGTAKVVLTGGDMTLALGVLGSYSEFNLRNNSNANTVFGNDVEIVSDQSSLKSVVMNLVTDTGGGGISATSNITSTLGNLKIGNNQEIVAYKNTTTGIPLTVAFTTVTAGGGQITFSPKKPGFGAANLDAGDIALGAITETSSSNIIMGGSRTLFLNGNNAFTGGLTINSGTVRLGNNGALNSTTPQVVTFNTFDTAAPGTLQTGGNTVVAGGVSATGAGASVIENAAATPGAITIKNTGTNTFAGNTRDGTGGGALSLTSDGGTLTLGGNNTYTGATTLLNNTTLQIGDGGTAGTLTATSGVSGSGTLVFNRNDSSTVTVPAPISGNVAIRKEGSHTVVLSGASTNSPATVINGGAFVVNGSLSTGGTVTLNSGTLSGNGNGTTGRVGNVTAQPGSVLTAGATALDNAIGALTMTSLNSNSANYRFDITNTTVGDRINVTGAATFTGSSSFSFNFTGLAGPGLYPLITAGNLNVAGATLTAVGPSGTTRLNFGLQTTPGANGTIKLNVTGAAANLTWTGAQTSDWDLVGASNWKTTTNTSEKYFELDAVNFDDTAPLAKHTVNVAGAFTPSSVTFNNNTDYTLNNGSISPNGGLFKSGTGKSIINSQVTGVGNVQVDGGILAFTADNNYTGTTTINANGTLQIGDLSVSSGLSGSIPDAPITNNGTLKFARGAGIDQTFTTLVSGTGQIMQSGTNTLTFNGTNNTLTGGATVNNGTLKIATNVGALGTGPITIATGGTFVSAIAGLSNPVILAGGTLSSSGLGTAAGTNITTGDVTVTADSTVWLYDPATPATGSEVDFAGALHGTKNINVLSQQPNPDGGAGFRLRGTLPSDYSGAITIGKSVKGELQTTVAGPFSPAGTGTIKLTGGTVTPTPTGGTATTVGDYSELNLRNDFTGNTTFGNNIELVGTGFADINLIGAVAVNGSTTTMGNLKIGDQQILGVNRNSGPTQNVLFTSATLTGGNATLSPTTGAGAGWTQLSGMNIFVGPISETAPSSITLDGDGILRMDGVNTYTGSTTVMRGTLQLGASNRIPDASPMILNGTPGTGSANPNPVFNTAGFSETLGTLSVQVKGGIDLGAGASVLHFAASDAATWTGILSIANWTPGSDHVFFGSSATGLGASITSPFSAIAFTGHGTQARILSTGEVLPGLSLLNGDFNQDGAITAADLPAMLQALTNIPAWKSGYALSDPDFETIANIDGTTGLTNRDIQAMIAKLSALGLGSVESVPEPSTFVLLACGVAGVLAVRRRRAK